MYLSLTVKNLNWDKFIKYYLKWWHEYFPVWLVNGTKYDHPVHVVKLEELKSNTLLEVQKMLNFLGFPYDVKDLTKRLRDLTSEERYCYCAYVYVHAITQTLTCVKNNYY